MATIVGEPPCCPACGVRVGQPDGLFWALGGNEDGEEVVRCRECHSKFLLGRTITVEYTVQALPPADQS